MKCKIILKSFKIKILEVIPTWNIDMDKNVKINFLSHSSKFPKKQLSLSSNINVL